MNQSVRGVLCAFIVLCNTIFLQLKLPSHCVYGASRSPLVHHSSNANNNLRNNKSNSLSEKDQRQNDDKKNVAFISQSQTSRNNTNDNTALKSNSQDHNMTEKVIESIDDDNHKDTEELTATKKRIHRLMDYESISLALRLTCEMNRRLSHQKKSLSSHRITSMMNDQHDLQQHERHHHHHQQQHYQSEQGTNMFQFNSSTKNNNKDMKSVITNLSSYVQSISNILGCDSNPIIHAIAIIYLDRACSCSISSSSHLFDNNNKQLRCPYLTSNTVHKLYLTAIVLACRTVRHQYPSIHDEQGYHDEYTMQYADLLRRHGDELCNLNITNAELGKWLNFMVSSLGGATSSLSSSPSTSIIPNNGLMISSEEVDIFIHRWKKIFVLEEVEEENIGSNQDNKQIFLGRDNNDMEQGQNKEDEPNNGSRSNSWDIYNDDKVLAIDQEGYVDIDRTTDDFDNSHQSYHGGEVNYYERGEINISQGNTEFGDGGGGADMWWTS